MVSSGVQIQGQANYTYETGVDGVGIRYYDSYAGTRRYWGKGASESYVGGWSWAGTKLGAELVVVGPLGGGTLTALPTANFSLDGLSVANVQLLPGTSLIGTTCSVTGTHINVTLPAVKGADFAQVGATAGEKSFNLNLDCSTAGTANAFITFTDNNQPGNTGNRLSLSPGSTAEGVQLQIFRNGTPVAFGPDSAVKGTLNQISLGTTAALSNVPLTVRYIRTGVVKPGAVSAVATFTLSYQ
jgi:type 1 fimbria pilin